MRELANNRSFEPLFRLLVDSSEWQRAGYPSDIKDSALNGSLRKQRANYIDRLRLAFLETHGAENNLRSVYDLLLLSKAIEVFYPTFDNDKTEVAYLSFASALGLPSLESLIDEYGRGGMTLEDLKNETHNSIKAARSVLAELSRDRYTPSLLMSAVMQRLVSMQQSLQSSPP